MGTGWLRSASELCRARHLAGNEHQSSLKQVSGYSIKRSRASNVLLKMSLAIVFLFAASLIALADSNNQNQMQVVPVSGASIPEKAPAGHRASVQLAGGAQRAALEAELNNIVQQHETLEDSDKQLAEAIISRLMLDNLTGSYTLAGNGDNQIETGEVLASEPRSAQLELTEQILSGGQDQEQSDSYFGPSSSEAIRLRKLISLLRNYEASSPSQLGAFSPFPMLPSSQVATMKRATSRILQQQSQQRPYSQTGYARNTFDFGMGKRPDSSGSSSILRFGDSAGSGAGGSMQPVSQFGKRPSAHRFDFGLGKRLASVSVQSLYPITPPTHCSLLLTSFTLACLSEVRLWSW